MAIDFPNSPTVNQAFTSGSTTWVWDGTAWNLQTTTTASNDSMPVGSIMWFAGSAAPTGWILCNGATYTNSTYPNLVAVIGTTFGGTPGTNFMVPNISATTGAYYIRFTTAVGVTSTLSLLSAPVGSMVQWPVTSSYPTGWLRCDGSNISRTSYADLFALIGTTYGTGDGSTTFTLPNISAAGSGSPVYIIKSTSSGLVEPSTVSHAASHVRGGTDIIDGDRLQVDYVPAGYLRNSATSGAGANTDLTAHLNGIDTAITPPFVTSLPVSPYDGQIIYYRADATNGIIWQLRYNASSASSYKWEFVGGSPIYAYVDAGQSWNYVGDYAGSTTVIITPPLTGDYVVDFSGGCGGSSGQLQVVGLKVKFNGSDVTGFQADYQAWTTQVGGVAMCKTMIRTGHTGGTTMQLFGTTNWAGASVNRRYLAARPIRVG